MTLRILLLAVFTFSNPTWAAGKNFDCILLVQKGRAVVAGKQIHFVATVPSLATDEPWKDGPAFKASFPLTSPALLVEMHFVNVPGQSGMTKSLLFTMILPNSSNSAAVDPLGFVTYNSLDSGQGVAVNCTPLN